MQVSAFTPRGANITTPAAQVSGAVTASVTQITLPALAQGENIARFMVDGTQPIFWCYGTNANLTTANGVPMVSNSVELFGIPGGTLTISVIAGTTGSTLRINLGDGS